MLNKNRNFLSRKAVCFFLFLSLAAYAGSKTPSPEKRSESTSAKTPHQQQEQPRVAHQPKKEEAVTQNYGDIRNISRNLFSNIASFLTPKDLQALARSNSVMHDKVAGIALPVDYVTSLKKRILEGSTSVHIIDKDRLPENAENKLFEKLVKSALPTIIDFSDCAWSKSASMKLYNAINADWNTHSCYAQQRKYAHLNLPVSVSCDALNLWDSFENIAICYVSRRSFSPNLWRDQALLKAGRKNQVFEKLIEHKIPVSLFWVEPKIPELPYIVKLFEVGQVFEAYLSHQCLTLNDINLQSLKRLRLGIKDFSRESVASLLEKKAPHLQALALHLDMIFKFGKEDPNTILPLALPHLKQASIVFPAFEAGESLSMANGQRFYKLFPSCLKRFGIKDLGIKVPLLSAISQYFDSLLFFTATPDLSPESTLPSWLEPLAKHKNLEMLFLQMQCPLSSRLRTTDAQKKEEIKNARVLFPNIKKLIFTIFGMPNQQDLADTIISALPLFDMHQLENDTDSARAPKYIECKRNYICDGFGDDGDLTLLILKLLKYSGDHVHFMLSPNAIKALQNSGFLAKKDEKRLKLDCISRSVNKY